MPQIITTPVIHKQVVTQSIKKLELCGCVFKVQTPWGDEFGTLEIMPKKKRTMNPNREIGELVNHYDKYIKYDAEVGEVFDVPAGSYPVEDVRGGICSKLSKEWGRQTYATAIVGNAVQVMRLDKGEK